MLKNVKLFLMITFLFTGSFYSQEIKVLTFNIRYDNPDDGINRWDLRKENVVNLINFYEPDLVGFQEVLDSQLEFLKMRLDDYQFYGVGRDDGKKAGEYSCIAVKKGKMKVKSSSTKWLSETPEVVSRGWDAACNRVVTTVEMELKGKKLCIMNTHFDHIGKLAQKESAGLLLKMIKEKEAADYFIITGDFNSYPDSEAYQIITGYLKDTGKLSLTGTFGGGATFNGFGKIDNAEKQPIDYIFINNKFKVLKHAILNNTVDGNFISDHYPVYTLLSF